MKKQFTSLALFLPSLATFSEGDNIAVNIFGLIYLLTYIAITLIFNENKYFSTRP